MGIRILATVMVLLAAAVGGTGGVFLWGKQQFEAPGPLREDGTIIIESGTGLQAIAEQLEQSGIIDNALVFEIAARLTDKKGPLKAGEYLIHTGDSASTILNILRSGRTHLRRFTIAEGLTSQQIVDQIMADDGFAGSIYFSLPPEGSLLPETYYYSRGEDRQDVIERMARGMSQLLTELWHERAPGLPLETPDDAVILASIVEKETGIADERDRVAAVFINRLRRGMRLQSDPTVAYGITLGRSPLDRALTRSDLKTDTPYNTYVINGLPPGPIANPGRAALEAVLNPAQSDELYFVADGSGGHAFAKTLDEHNQNVRAWRKIRDETGAQ